MKKVILIIISYITIIDLLIPVTFAKYVIENSVVAVELDIDRTKPTAIVSYSTLEITNENVIVTLTFSEPVEEIEGWSISDDGLSYSKIYEQNSRDTIIITDLAQNENIVEVLIQNISK